MSLIGYVFNKALKKSIPVLIAESGPGFKCFPSLIDQSLKEAALAIEKERVENGSVFNDEDLKLMEKVTITHMAHQSPGDPNMHYSVQGESSDDVKVKGGHIPLDSSKQTQAK